MNDISIPHDYLKWGFHVIGMDSIFAAHDFKTACEKANSINILMIPECFDKSLMTYYPVVFANVFIWDEDLHGGHNPGKTNWEEFF